MRPPRSPYPRVGILLGGLVVLASLAACGGSSSGPPPVGDVPTQDAGVDAAPAPLPDDLPTCTDTAEPSPKPDGTVTLVPDDLRVPLGWIIRDKAPLPNGRLFQATQIHFVGEVNAGALLVEDARPAIGDEYTDLYQNAPDLENHGVRTASSVGAAMGSKQAELFRAYAERSTPDPKRQVYWRTFVRRHSGKLMGFDQVPREGAEPTRSGDAYVWHTNAMQVIDTRISFTFSKDAACHVSALRRILELSPDAFVRLPDLLSSSRRASVERYLRERAPTSVAVAAMITTSPSLEALRDDISKGCDLRDLAACERYMAKVTDGVRQAFDAVGKGVLTVEQFEPGGKLPTGYIQGYIDAQGMP